MLEKLVIKGGRELRGTVRISGAKNAVLPIMFATLLADDICIIKNVPRLRDVKTTIKILELLGCKVDFKDSILRIDPSDVRPERVPYEIVKTMRASILALGPLVARFKEAEVSLPGGCAIGARPVDLHIKGLSLMGCDIVIEHGYIKAKAERLRPAEIHLDIPSVTGTENLLFAASMTEQTTIINNAAMEPEISDLIEVLSKMGVYIEGKGTSRLIVHGKRTPGSFEHSVIPDRIEAGTFLVAGAITAGDIVVEDVVPDHLDSILMKLIEVGCEIEVWNGRIRIKGSEKINPCSIQTNPYPGFPTDMQAQFMSLLALANGTSIIRENIFENRFIHVAELCRMGADIKIDGNTAIINGVTSLTGSDVMATDLRASASLVLAGLVAEGTTVVHRIYHLDRGYESMEHKLRLLGADIIREKDEHV